MSVKHWSDGHNSDRLRDLLARPLIALAAIVGSAHDVFGADAEEDEAGAALDAFIWAVCILAGLMAAGLAVLFVAWLAGGGPR